MAPYNLQIDAFTPEFWGGPVYHDTTMAFYKAVNGGDKVLHGSVMGLLNPFGAVWKRINAVSSGTQPIKSSSAQHTSQLHSGYV